MTGMNTKLKELTQKIYLEGVEKGKADADKIIADAQNEAALIVSNAKNEATQILIQAEDRANLLMQQTQSELQFFARQSVNALKTEITNLLCSRLVSESVKPAVNDKLFMQELILTMARNWVNDQEIIIGTSEAEALREYFEKNAKDLLQKGVQIEASKQIKAEFTISPVGQNFKITFGEEEFEAFFREFLRPELIRMLF